MIDSDNSHFRTFATSLEAAIEHFGQVEGEDFLDRQRRQMETLIALEKEFRNRLTASAVGEKIYAAFIHYIRDERGNILDGRPYFRERQKTFTKWISPACRRGSPRALFRFKINYRFIQFVLRAHKWRPKSMIVRLAEQIKAVRDELVVMNMPLAISRARIFYSRTQRSHLSHMDLVQIAAEGLMSGIDKFVPPFSRVFRAVAIGRMTGNFIEDYSQTLIKYWPKDKRMLYRAHKLSQQNLEPDALAERVNDGVRPAHHVTGADISQLMAAASPVSSETPVGYDGGAPHTLADTFVAPDEMRPDVECERLDASNALSNAIEVGGRTGVLSIYERKLLRLKGIR